MWRATVCVELLYVESCCMCSYCMWTVTVYVVSLYV